MATRSHLFEFNNRWLRHLRPYAIILAGLACDSPIAPIPVATVTISRDTATLVPDADLTLSAIVADAKGTTLQRPIIWTSSDAAIASVVAGKVTGHLPGSAIISAKSEAVTATSQITVKDGGVIAPSGSVLSVKSGQVVLEFPNGAVSSPTAVSVEEAVAVTASPRLVPSTAFKIDAGSTALTLPIKVSIRYDASKLRTGAPQSGLKLYTLIGNEWQRVAGSTANTANTTVSASVSAFGVYAILEQAPGTAVIDAGNNQSATVGTAVAVAPSIKVTDSEGFTVPGVQVSFALTSGGGVLSGASATTGSDGIATLTRWVLGSVAGTNTVTATVTGAAGGPFVFTATGTPGAPASLSFQTAPSSTSQSRIALPQQPAVRLLDSFGNAISTAGITVSASLSSGTGTISGTTSVATNAAGVASFTNLAVGGATGSKTLTFAATGLSSLNASLLLTSGTAASIAKNSGDNQTGVAGGNVGTPPSVKVSDADGNAVAGVSVQFSVTSGNGSIVGNNPTSDASGIAQVTSWKLGSVAGTNTISATSAGLTGSPVTFSATAGAGAAGRLRVATAASDTVRNRIVFARQPVIQVEDSLGNPVAQSGRVITASIASGGGSLGGTVTATTDASGIARFTDLSVTGTTGPRTLAFTSSSVTSASSNVRVIAGVAASLAINGGDGQSAPAGQAVFTAPSVVVKDADGNPVSGITVTFAPASGSGSVSSPSSVTDADGIATAGSWTLGAATGSNSMVATIAELSGVSVTFTATATAGSPASISLISGDSQSAPAGRVVKNPIQFRVLDANGNPVAGATVNFSISTGAGSVSNASVATSTDGTASLTGWRLGPGTGTQTVTATVSGLSNKSATAQATAVTLRIITFGDSNTDWGFVGGNSTVAAWSYISWSSNRPPASAANSSTQVAGKIEALWSSNYSPAISAVNHAIAGTTTGATRGSTGAPGAQTRFPSNGYNRYEAEVLGMGFPWNGGEPVGTNYPGGGITRIKAFTPGANDFLYLSMGTADAAIGMTASETVENLTWMVDYWINIGLPADHLIITTLAPTSPQLAEMPSINRSIRLLASQRKVKLIDLAAYTSNDDGLTWKTASMHVGDGIHYVESVRDWLAQQTVEVLAAVTSGSQ